MPEIKIKELFFTYNIEKTKPPSMKNFVIIVSLITVYSCSVGKSSVKTNLKDNNTFEITEVSTNKNYGLTPKNPVQVGGVSENIGPLNEVRYLNALAGPNGEKLTFYRAGSCCPIESDNDPFGFGKVMLDNYRVTWEGSKDTVSIFINMYDSGKLMAPRGFTIKK